MLVIIVLSVIALIYISVVPDDDDNTANQTLTVFLKSA
jgi:hypothetical protein